MGVVVASNMTKSGSTIKRQLHQDRRVKDQSGYAPGQMNSRTGTIVATFCG
jgi:hypothetical protein